MLTATYLIGRKLSNSFYVGLASVAFLSSLIFFQDKATEIRPEVLQNVLGLVGVYLILRNIGARRGHVTFLVGFLFGAAVMTNAGTLAAVVAVCIFFMANYFLRERNLKNFLLNILLLTAGFASVLIIFVLYFSSVNALSDFLFFNLDFNIHAFFMSQTRNFVKYALFFLNCQLGFVLSCLMGFTGVIYYLISSRSEAREEEYIKHLFFLIVAVVTSSNALLGFYSQHHLSFLPFLSIMSAYGLSQLKKLLGGLTTLGRIEYALIFVLVFANLLYPAIQKAPRIMESSLKEQKELTDFILNNTERSEPVLFTWNSCGSYVFNEDAHYYWMTSEGYHIVFNEIEGYNVFGRHLINLLEEKKVRYIISSKDYFNNISSETLEYIDENYHPKNHCLLERKDSDTKP